MSKVKKKRGTTKKQTLNSSELMVSRGEVDGGNGEIEDGKYT